ncbi:ATP-dependent DNA helicase RecG [Clostridium ganghwense]|uniref:ATP-dependent DNA helicase RecG n=1 Tax=Clostridium ganghwense TaxID=312089 RepID=A0ABT4CTH1_9CLOT|nr:ATP-dependent DNA helicase RecG [Clostridium ganghwense]MCY6372370.1 ATP-dependent DNA helicase RecG [Clostridium ganghwense]
MNVNDKISVLKGIGPKTKEVLNQCGIFTILDFILYFPRDYENNEYCDSIVKAEENKKIIIKAKVKQIKKDAYIRKNMIITTIVFNDGKENFEAKWFNQPYIKNKFNLSNEYILLGKLEIQKSKKNLMNPIMLNKGEIREIRPKYSLKGKLNNNFFVKTNLWILDNINIEDNLPNKILDTYDLCSLDKAIRNIHKPRGKKELEEAKKRLKFQELFTYSLKLLMIKSLRISEGTSFKIVKELKDLKEKLPFNLTNAQSRVVREILIDEKKDVPMNRLVQGDVGSGKTIVSIITLFNVIQNGYQGVLMAPTEILAMQHYVEAQNILKDFNVNIELLCGSTTIKNKKRIKEDLKDGKIDIIVGTHALLEDDVVFRKLGMIVTDEQHRFGVRQRSKLFNKDSKVDILVMTATPIPRTLALTLYGDLDISCINELPPGRKKIDTYYADKTMRKRVYNFALKEIEKGRQVYVVCPFVEENEKIKISSVEKLYSELKEEFFSDIEIGILHGKMASKDKEEVMNKFKNGKIKVLVATTVIEVGVNVPNATLMIIENAERFGLSQLHQLRGRVGRGDKKSYCILIADAKSEITRRRMEIMTKSNDGFYIAEEDLKLRGSGEIFGVSQHGEDGFLLANLVQDIHLFKIANTEAKRIINSNLQEDMIIKNEILKKLEQTSRYICFN